MDNKDHIWIIFGGLFSFLICSLFVMSFILDWRAENTKRMTNKIALEHVCEALMEEVE